MPAQLSTVLYISQYTETVSQNYFVGSAVGVTRLDDKNSIQLFNITVFYPTDQAVPCYVPKLSPGQVLSINNCKFSKGDDNKIDVIIFVFYNFLLFTKCLIIK
jgi:hypothetical protein